MEFYQYTDMTQYAVWFEAADGYSIKQPEPQKQYKPYLFAQTLERTQA